MPPSQGGKYSGFGSSYEPPAKEPDVFADALSSFTTGFSLFSSKAVELAKIAAKEAEVLGSQLNEKVLKPSVEKIQDPNFRQNISVFYITN